MRFIRVNHLGGDPVLKPSSEILDFHTATIISIQNMLDSDQLNIFQAMLRGLISKDIYMRHNSLHIRSVMEHPDFYA